MKNKKAATPEAGKKSEIRIKGGVMEKTKQLILNVDKESGIITFDNLEDFEQIEVLGILHCALASADVIYKTKVMSKINEAIEDIKKEKPVYETIGERFINILAEHCGLEAGEINYATKLIEDLGLDSLDIVEINIKTETEFGITIPDEDIERMQTVGGCINYLRTRLNESE